MQLAHDPRGHAWVQHRLACGSLADGLGQLVRARFFEDIRESSGPDSGLQMPCVIELWHVTHKGNIESTGMVLLVSWLPFRLLVVLSLVQAAFRMPITILL